MRSAKTRKTKVAVATVTLSAVLAATRPAMLATVQAATPAYEWDLLEDLDLLGGHYTSAAVSASGSHMILGVAEGGEDDDMTSPLFVSRNSGATWENVADEVDPEIRNHWRSVDVSDDGQTMVAVSDWTTDFDFNLDEGNVFVSEDAGNTWDEVTPTANSNGEWIDAVVAGDSSKVIVTEEETGELRTTTNGGDSWSTVAVDDFWNTKSISVSDDGGTILVGGENTDDPYTRLYISENAGSAWTDISPNHEDEIWGLTHDISADGSAIVATTNGFADGDNDSVFVSSDSGDDWAEVNPDEDNLNFWTDASISDDGSTIAVQDDQDDANMYITSDDGLNWTDENPDQAFGEESEWVASDFNADGSEMIVAGRFNAYISAAGEPAADSDGDGTSDATEDAAPNGGDANNDGTPDSDQHNVSSFVNPVTGDYSAVVVNDDCILTEASARSETANAVKDSGYSYAGGFTNFSADCAIDSTVVTIYQYGLLKEGMVVRKYNPNTNAYFTVPNATLGQQTIDGKTVVTASYTVTDGGDLDIDGAENGTIVDPVGFGVLAVGSPNTGFGPRK